MSHHPSRRMALAVLAAFAAGATLADEPRGTFGLVAKIDADGVFNPTLKSVHVQSVQPGMPAALAGIVAGDAVVEVDGIKVAGARAAALAERMKKKPGEAVALRLLRANGESYLVTLVAVAARR